MAKIIVGGCSFSDNAYGITPWGAIVARELNYDYIHAAASAGSNFRIWRTLTNHIADKTITSDDIIIVQYTMIDRKEYWSPYVHEIYDHAPISEHYDNGTLIRLTPHFREVAQSQQEIKLSQCHNYFSNNKFNLETFWYHHFMFANMCENLNITVRYLNTLYDENHKIADIDGTGLLDNTKWTRDSSHLNQDGMYIAAELVLQELKKGRG